MLFQWLIDELGSGIVQQSQAVLPTEEFFPDQFDGSEASVRHFINRVCEYMDVDPDSLFVRFEYSEDDMIHPLASSGERRGHVLGTYRPRRDGKSTITLDLNKAHSPQSLIATVAHELGHVILLGEDRLDPDYEDHEYLTDLLTVFYGMGIFNANSALVFEQWTNQQYQGWQISSSGYMTEEMYGYSLGLFAAIRGETKPEWSRYLNTNVKSYLKTSLKFIERNGLPLKVKGSSGEQYDKLS